MNLDESETVMSKWKNIPGSLVFSVGKSPDGTWITEDNRPLPGPVCGKLSAVFPDAAEDFGCELEISFRSTGYYDPGRYTGPAENCYPAERQDERSLDHVTIFLDGKKVSDLSTNAAEELFDMFASKIRDVELDFGVDE